MHTKWVQVQIKLESNFFSGQILAKALLCTEKTLVEVYYMQLLIVLRSQEALKIIHAI